MRRENVTGVAILVNLGFSLQGHCKTCGARYTSKNARKTCVEWVQRVLERELRDDDGDGEVVLLSVKEAES